ncbi:hypothetical protein BuS5_02356 [Desulfosarcina sp. BuS5]|uniref:LegC family aminotransferase n=1 Tax=Desulfosarcina sp. BuS5 TaxID=933262 RepID=UPI000AF9020D|nr:LegC family aminotransferase [Desulfosarcina sp. BuS5]WDN89388.1 hypothetical protein BuS5_02356 [Desulfosarcina sp. BuS5]
MAYMDKTSNFPETILTVLKDVLPKDRKFIPLHEPKFNGKEIEYVTACIDSTFVSSVGKYVDKFEKMLEEYTGVKKAVAVMNGTSALHIALKLANVRQGDEVIMPALTFVATANAVSYLQAVPHFADIDEKRLGIDPVKLKEYLEDIGDIREEECYNKKTGKRIKAVLPVHVFGHPAELDFLNAICEKFKLTLIEDAAESLGSFYKGRHTGNWGKLSALSFNGNKIITTGAGGAILTNDETLGIQAKHITTTAKNPHKWNFSHNQIGYNYRMPNINATLGCAQLERLEYFVEKKRTLAKRYMTAFNEIDGVRFVAEPEDSRSNYWLNTILLDKKHANLRDLILKTTNTAGIMTRPAWKLMPSLPMYEHCPGMDLTVAEKMEKRIINIPSSADL